MKLRDFTRREFIKTSGVLATGSALIPGMACTDLSYDAKGLPTTLLGKTGIRIPIMVLGLGSRFMEATEDAALQILETALKNGLYYWDTASIYKNGTQFSEERIGKILPAIRKKVFLSTKVGERSGEEAKKTIETSLKRLQTDYIDLYQIHSVLNEEEVRQFGSPDGVLPVLKKYQEEGIIKFIGFTGHTSADAMKLAAEMYDFDTMLIAMNHHQKGSQPFEEQPIPFAASRGMGVLAMKIIRPRETVQGISADDLLKYALSLKGVTAAVVGTDSVEVLNRNIETIKSFKPLEESRMKELHGMLAPFYKSKSLPWMHPEYFDGMKLA